MFEVDDISLIKTNRLIEEIERRGYIVRSELLDAPVLSWNRIVETSRFNIDAFKYESLHKISSQLSIEYLRFHIQKIELDKTKARATLEIL